MIVAVDFDNTLAIGNAQHISTLAPNRPLIARLRDMKAAQPGTQIKVWTARGGKDGLSDEKRELKYGKVIREWLNKYGVPFDGICWKDYANLYIDDQTITPYSEFTGITSTFTGNPVILTESTAIKYAASALFEYDWYKRARLLGFSVPDVLFCNDECIITRRVPGQGSPTAEKFIFILDALKYSPKVPFCDDFLTYMQNVQSAKVDGMSEKTRTLAETVAWYEHPATFFHGDLSTTNLLCTADGDYLIDPNCKHIFGSYLTDAGKAAFSLIAYEAQFPEAQKIADHFGPEVWPFAVYEGLRVCKYQPKYISIVNNIADLI